METLRICIGCNDGFHAAPTHMGDTRQFRIYDVRPEQRATFVEARANIAVDSGHAGAEKMKKILGVLHDVDVLIAQKNSPNFKNIAAQTRHQPIVVKTETVEGALRLVRLSFEKIKRLVERRRLGERPSEIPVFRTDTL